MAFGADNVQTAHGGDEAAFFDHVFLAQDLRDRGFPDVRGNVEPSAILIFEASLGDGFGVAAKNDVGAAAGHVGGDRRRRRRGPPGPRCQLHGLHIPAWRSATHA